MGQADRTSTASQQSSKGRTTAPLALKYLLPAGIESDCQGGMAHATLTQTDWDGTVEQLGGADRLEREARETGAFARPREVKSPVDMLQIVLAYCLGASGLRLTAAWAEERGLASFSKVAVLYRLRQGVPWLELIVARLLSQAVPGPVRLAPGGGRPIRLIDATVVCKAGRQPRRTAECSECTVIRATAGIHSRSVK